MTTVTLRAPAIRAGAPGRIDAAGLAAALRRRVRGGIRFDDGTRHGLEFRDHAADGFRIA
jgi:hypothetical protein